MTPPLHAGSSVCGLIPHYDCEQWLAGAIESLLEQTRPLDGIVVIDDASPHPPLDVVRRYPDVTLLAAEDNGGPYRLVQAVIDATDFDAYLFQDADDWSAQDRLEVLLATAGESGAELVGSHEVRVLVDQADMQPWRYPLDVNAALLDRPSSFPLLHPTSLVSRDLVTRLGGFATGMRFSGDAEFLRRAGHAARVVNADHVGYFRRKRGGSLTTSAQTGFGSPARQQVQAALSERAHANAEAVGRGATPDLSPWKQADAPALARLAGPEPVAAARPRPVVPQPRPPASGAALERPVFVVAPLRSGDRALAWALGQHPALHTLSDSGWLARSAVELARVASADGVPPPAGFAERMASALAELAVGSQPQRWVASLAADPQAAWPLARLYPGATFVFLARPVEESVAALLDSPTDGQSFFTSESAHRQWATVVRIGLDLEAALAPDRVLRVSYAELLSSPASVLKRCHALLGLPEAAACRRPFEHVAPPAVPEAAADSLPASLAGVVRELTEQVAAGVAGDRAAARVRLDAALHQVSSEPVTLVDKVRALVRRTVPEASTVVVVSRGDDALLALGARTAWHLPQVEDGTYAGHHPADSGEAVAQLVDVQRRGAEFLLVPAPSLWWLSFYDGLRSHLGQSCRLVAYEEDAGAVYRLGVAPAPEGPHALRWGASRDDEERP